MIARVLFVVGASGVGKNSLMEGLAKKDANVKLAPRLVTSQRPDGSGDQQVNEELLREMQLAGKIFLSWRAHDITYAVPNDFEDCAINDILLINGARRALPGLMAKYPHSLVVHITAPREERARRLAARGREDASSIAKRLEDLSWEPELVPERQFAEINNDQDLETGIARLEHAIKNLSGQL